MRGLSRLLVLIIASGLLISCGKKEEDASGRTIIRFLSGPDIGGGAKEIIANFEKAYPDIKVEMIEGPAATNTREDMYSTSFMAEEDTYDLAYMDVVWVPTFAARGWLKPLDDWFTPAMQDEHLPGDIMGSTFRGHIYRMPVQSDGGMLYYRKDLLEKAGIAPPETFADLVATAKKLQNPPELWGFVFQGKQYEGLVCDYLELLWGNGGQLIDENGEVTLDSPEAAEALGWLADAVHKDKISPMGVLTFQEEEGRHMFQEGKAIFMRNWPYAWNLLQGEKSPVKGKVGIMPMVRGKGKSAATLGGWGYGISAFSKHPEAAWKYAQFASSVESQKILYHKGGIIPTRKSLFNDAEIIEKSPHYKQLFEVLSGARPRPMHPEYARISDALQIHLSAALSRQETPEEAIKAAAKEIRRITRK